MIYMPSSYTVNTTDRLNPLQILAEIWVIDIFAWLDLLQILRIPAAFSLCGSLLIVSLLKTNLRRI